MQQNPFQEFEDWFTRAKAEKSIAEPTAMSLATADENAKPSVRIVLLKAFDERGFIFYTNLDSHKSQEIKVNAQLALCFYWMPLDKQIRIEGRAERIADAEADAYFATRVREKQIGAWASLQSQPMHNHDDLDKRIAEMEAKFENQEVPRPPHWSGWRVVPHRIEFWQQGEFRLHDRVVYTQNAHSEWETEKLFP
jgi:pyridoxamine 5'-phosphate oxidase